MEKSFPHTKTQRNMVAILRILRDAPGPLGADRIATCLRNGGTELSERAVRNYLAQADANEWTQNLGRRGRCLTAAGRQEVDGALVMDKVGFVSARVDELTYRMSFDPYQRQGTVVLNVSTLALRNARAALGSLLRAYSANLGMGRLLAIGYPGEHVGGFEVPPDRLAIGTVCSVSLNGIFLRSRIPMRARFGGLLQIEDGAPKRFTQIIHYDGTSLDPLEIFIRGAMTSVSHVARTGSGIIGASFREAPSSALPEIRRLAALSEAIGIGGLFALGLPSQPLLGIPVPQGCVGLVVAGGLNPIAAIVESSVPANSSAMHSLCDFDRLAAYSTFQHLASRMTKPWPKT